MIGYAPCVVGTECILYVYVQTKGNTIGKITIFTSGVGCASLNLSVGGKTDIGGGNSRRCGYHLNNRFFIEY
jgi:hypothetical protein